MFPFPKRSIHFGKKPKVLENEILFHCFPLEEKTGNLFAPGMKKRQMARSFGLANGMQHGVHFSNRFRLDKVERGAEIAISYSRNVRRLARPNGFYPPFDKEWKPFIFRLPVVKSKD